MGWFDLEDQERENIITAHESGQDLSRYAELLGIKTESLQREIQRHKKYAEFFASQTKMTPMSRRKYLDFPKIEADDAVVISDLEIPDADEKYLESALDHGRQYNIKRLIIAGDTMATDQQALNDWVDLYRNGSEVTYRGALAMMKDMLAVFLTWFTDIHIISGNHDDRISRKTHGEVVLGDFLDGIDAIYSPYPYIWLKTRRGWFYICHPRQYSKDSVSLGRKLYTPLVDPDGAKNIKLLALGHTHQMQEGFSDDGLCEIYGLGCIRDPEKTKYQSMSVTTYPRWNQGYLIIKNANALPVNHTRDYESFFPINQK